MYSLTNCRSSRGIGLEEREREDLLVEMAEVAGMNGGQPMEQDASMTLDAGDPSTYVTPEHFTSLKYFQVGE